MGMTHDLLLLMVTLIVLCKAYKLCWCSSVHIVSDYTVEDQVTGFDSRQRQKIFPLVSVSRPALGPTQHPVQWVPGVLSPGRARPVRDADHSPPSSAEVKNE
jgi:hypothetical protein